MEAQLNGLKIMEGNSIDGGICELTNMIVPSTKKFKLALFSAGTNDDVKLMHRRAAHVSVRTLQKMQRVNAADVMQQKEMIHVKHVPMVKQQSHHIRQESNLKKRYSFNTNDGPDQKAKRAAQAIQKTWARFAQDISVIIQCSMPENVSTATSITSFSNDMKLGCIQDTSKYQGEKSPYMQLVLNKEKGSTLCWPTVGIGRKPVSVMVKTDLVKESDGSADEIEPANPAVARGRDEAAQDMLTESNRDVQGVGVKRNRVTRSTQWSFDELTSESRNYSELLLPDSFTTQSNTGYW